METKRARWRRYSQTWREKHPKRWQATRRGYRDRLRQYVIDAKSAPCSDCKVRYPHYVMQFDHVRGRKKFNIGAYRAGGYGLATLKTEIAKCEVVCANCHAARTWALAQK